MTTTDTGRMWRDMVGRERRRTAARYGYSGQWLTPYRAVQANLVGVKVLDAQRAGAASARSSRALTGVVAHKAALNIRVLNLSVGHPVGESYATDPLCQACERAWAAGITVVCAAGNYGRSVPDGSKQPARSSAPSPVRATIRMSSRWAR